MANTIRNASSTLLQPVLVPEPTSTRAPLAQESASLHPLASLADAGLRASMASKPSKNYGTGYLELPRPHFTGAAAIADNADQKRRREEEGSRLQSVNPAVKAMSALRGGFPTSQGVSRLSETPLLQSQNVSCSPNLGLSEARGADQLQAPMVSMRRDKSESVEKLHHNQNKHPTEHNNNVERQIPVPSDHYAERSNKAVTYPPPQPEEEQVASARRLSLPPSNLSIGDLKSTFKKHKCPFCSTEFTRHHNLKSHLLTHSKEKPFLCSTCHHRFRRLHDLKRHAKLHTGERSHICSKCGRRFARGDALARHSKGPGGCAGRRGSVDADEEYGDIGPDGDESMTGVVYGREDQDSDHSLRDRLEDERSMGDSNRRKSEPHQHQRHNSQSEGSPGTHRSSQHPSTYPGSSVIMAAPRAVYPKIPAVLSPQDEQRLSSPRGGAPGYSFVPFNAPPSIYGQGSMTESPRPLSPGHDSNRSTAAEARPPSHHSHTTSLTSISQNTYSERPHSGGMMHYGSSQSNLLPSLTSMTGHRPFSPHLPPHISNKSNGGSGVVNAPAAPHAMPHTTGIASNASSLTPHHRSSGGSTRELFSGGMAPGTLAAHDREGNMWEHLQSLEVKLARVQEDCRAQEAHYKAQEANHKATIARLQGEVDSLRAQRNVEGQQP